MTTKQNQTFIFSKFSLAIAEDSGWFKVEMSKAEEFYYGKNSGCDMLNKSCLEQSFPKFCDFIGQKSCSQNHRFIDECVQEEQGSDCFVKQQKLSCFKEKKNNVYSQFNHDNDSICMLKTVLFFIYNNYQTNKSRIKKPKCFDISCNINKKEYTVHLFSGYNNQKIDFVCDKKGKKMTGIRSKIFIICEDPVEICKGITSCKDDCKNR